MQLGRLEILLTPGLLVSRRSALLGSRRGGDPAVSEPIEQTGTGTDWRPAVAALRGLLVREARYAMRVDIALSGLWVRPHLVPAMPGNLGADEMLLLARAHFGRQYPEASQESWTFRLARQGPRLLAAAMESSLLEAVKGANAAAGARLRRMEPLFSWVCDRFEKSLATATGWMLLDEPGLLTLACLEHGQLTSLYPQRCDGDQDALAVRLLERQSALCAHQSAEVHVFSVDGRIIRLPAPWRVARHQRVFDPEMPTEAPPVPAPLSRQL